uniref:(northern house mosquito) hypothetical protein n=1 Tax=Culex pipiens TaxID=7175 RepID=A0A8D7ZY90_CULPI
MFWGARVPLGERITLDEGRVVLEEDDFVVDQVRDRVLRVAPGQVLVGEDLIDGFDDGGAAWPPQGDSGEQVVRFVVEEEFGEGEGRQGFEVLGDAVEVLWWGLRGGWGGFVQVLGDGVLGESLGEALRLEDVLDAGSDAGLGQALLGADLAA